MALHSSLTTVICCSENSAGAGVGVLVGVGVAGAASGAAQLAESVVPSGFVYVAVRFDPGGPVTATLLGPSSEKAALLGPPGVML
jgi:hypothetical protein